MRLGGRGGFFAALAFFLFLRLWMVELEWAGRVIPPEPDDAYHYLYQARWSREAPFPAEEPLLVRSQKAQLAAAARVPDVRYWMSASQPYFAWSWVFGKLWGLTSSSPEEAFRISFRLGTLFLSLCAGLFALAFGWGSGTWCLLALSAFCGAGAWHGFFWVVPSLYALCLYWLLFAVLCGTRFEMGRWIFSGLLVPPLILVHPSGAVVLGVLLCTFFFESFFRGKGSFRRRIAGALGIVLPPGLCGLGTVILYVAFHKAGFSPEILFSPSTARMGLTGGATGSPGLVDLLKLGAAGLAAWIGSWSIRARRARLLAVQIGFFSGLSLVLFASGSAHPKRFFLFLVPLLFVFAAGGARRLLRWRRDRAFRRAFKAAALLVLALLIGRSLLFHRSFGEAKKFEYQPAAFSRVVSALPAGFLLLHRGLFPVHYLASHRGLDFRSHDLELNPALPSESRIYWMGPRGSFAAQAIPGVDAKALFRDGFWELQEVTKAQR